MILYGWVEILISVLQGEALHGLNGDGRSSTPRSALLLWS